MKRLYLASSIDRTAKSIAKDIGKKARGMRLAFITTASEAEDPPYDWQDADRKGLIDAGFDFIDYTITDKTKKDFDKDLKNTDIIHVNGGNTFYLLLQARKSGFDKWIVNKVEKGKIYIGSSAGSIIAGNKCPDYLLDIEEVKSISNSEGFGLVNFTVMPHWNSRLFKKLYLDDRMSIAYKSEESFILLNDYQYVKVEGDMYKIVDVRG